MRTSFLQSTAWLEFQKSVGRQAWRFDNGKIQSNIMRHDLPFGKNYLYIPHGPHILFDEIEGSLDHQLKQYLHHIRTMAAEQKSIFVKFEPATDSVVEQIFSHGLQKSNKEIQPHRSVVLDLAPAEDVLLAQMHHKTRYNIKVAQRNGITVRESTDINLFWDLLKKTTERDKFFAHEKSYYEKLAGLRDDLKTALFIAYRGDVPVAGAIILKHVGTAYYLHGASDYEYRSFMAPYALHWEIIRYLKTTGMDGYDFWGIDAQRWPGVTRFKLGWGGRQIEYPGAFDLPISKFWYFLYNLARKIKS